MSDIQILDQLTIDKIAAGEVIERPSSIVKELVENSIDAGATAVTIEIKEGGITFIRITDNGQGIEKEQIPLAFLRHSTSKIRSVDDLVHVASLGFRGEALSSIAAISQVEFITKRPQDGSGSRYMMEGGTAKSLEDIGAPDGTTFLIHQIFYNTPARRKFLKTPMTEASHVNELVTRLALSHPEISFQFITNGQEKLHTSGNGNLKDVIYHIFGREIANHVIEVQGKTPDIKLTGFIGKPLISRGNRNYETFFINGRYVKSSIISKAIEDAYKGFTMQHRYPFTVLHIEMHGNDLDVNVHPTKMELRFRNQQQVYRDICETIKLALHERETIPVVEVPEPVNTVEAVNNYSEDYFIEKMKERVAAYHQQESAAEVRNTTELLNPGAHINKIKETVTYNKPNQMKPINEPINEQLNLFQEHLLRQDVALEYRLIGQLFQTYWLVEFKEQLYIIDQHAAHEKVLYEQMIKGILNKEFTSQYVDPPIILNLTMQEAQLLGKHLDSFTKIGFEIEAFGGDAFAVRAVPANLYSIAKEDLLIEMLDHLSESLSSNVVEDTIAEKIASMSCKAAVKGNSKLSESEVDHLIGELLQLDNPYHCPHGRPTIIAMTKKEIEKKFKRIV
ncbi:MAG: DNA mismatch repair endonuclease MutL [Lachnospiraceae bacterium]